MADQAKPLAVVTGASTGIGYELAKCCAENGFDLVVAADEPRSHSAASELKALGAKVEALEVGVATADGVERLAAAVGPRPVDALLANAGRGLDKGFLDQDFAEVQQPPLSARRRLGEARPRTDGRARAGRGPRADLSSESRRGAGE